MGVLNHIFGGRKGLSKELFSDSKELLEKWDDFIKQSEKKDSLSMSFSYRNIDYKNITNALKDRVGLSNVLTDINELIQKEIIDIEDDEKLESEIISDLERLKSHTIAKENERLRDSILDEKDVQKNVLKIFNRLYETLITELHTIKLIQKKLSDNADDKTIKELLVKLFELISFQEHKLVLIFKKTTASNSPLRSRIDNITKSVLMQEKLEKEMISVEEKFVYKMKNGMVDEDSDSAHRRLALNIFFDLLQEVGHPFSTDEDREQGMKDIDELIKNDEFLLKIIKKHRPKYDDKKLKLTMDAFRKAHSEVDFSDSFDSYT